jgi:predicted translin family RNA/ssDNA-binding protein
MKAYRSYRNGRSLIDWMENLETIRNVNIDYLYSYVYTNSIVKDKDAMVTSYQYQLRTAQNQLAEVNEKIATVKSILDSYKNDEIFVSMQESDSSKSTRTTTDYYNGLVIDQTDNYEKAATLETRIADLQGKIAALSSQTEQVNLETAEAELKTAVETTANVYQGIREHMAELFASAENTHYAEYSAAYGEGASFLSANMQKMILGAVLGAVIACVLWFMSALMPEFHRGSENDKAKEAKRA